MAATRLTPSALRWIALVRLIGSALNWGLGGASNRALVTLQLGQKMKAGRTALCIILAGIAAVQGLAFLARSGKRTTAQIAAPSGRAARQGGPGTLPKIASS